MADPADFVRANTRLLAPPLTPEIRLHLASEVVPLWRKTEEELEAEGVPPPYWAFAWAGGQALARYLLDHRPCVAGKSVLDFGAGSGIVAIAAAMVGAAGVLAADIDAFARAAIEANAAANGARIEVSGEDLIGSDRAWDAILLGDMCYERPLAERLLDWLGARAKSGTLVLLGDPGRTYFPKLGVERLATFRVETTRELEDREIRETAVYRLIGGP
ncbi:MAG TPA: 50S ribosomal protein L11 methyltransferase [Rhizomicrobium sp.]|nr:50S ribosomal protein L11 methyltransferase [Rhizomicrobium sp.]